MSEKNVWIQRELILLKWKLHWGFNSKQKNIIKGVGG